MINVLQIYFTTKPYSWQFFDRTIGKKMAAWLAKIQPYDWQFFNRTVGKNSTARLAIF